MSATRLSLIIAMLTVCFTSSITYAAKPKTAPVVDDTQWFKCTDPSTGETALSDTSCQPYEQQIALQACDFERVGTKADARKLSKAELQRITKRNARINPAENCATPTSNAPLSTPLYSRPVTDDSVVTLP